MESFRRDSTCKTSESNDMHPRKSMTNEEYYGGDYGTLVAIKNRLDNNIEGFILTHDMSDETKPVIYHRSRIKTPNSLDSKLASHNCKPGYESAKKNGIHDIVGARVVCAFIDDVYSVAAWLMKCPEYEMVQTKDYIAYPKDNGYRSLHMIMRIVSGIGQGMLIEIQLRTIAMDFWSTLEHKVKYKKEIPNEDMIRKELKRCADEIASVDMDMQSIRDSIRNATED